MVKANMCVPPLREFLFRATKCPGTNKAGEIIMVPHTCHTRSNHSTFSTTVSEQTTSGKVGSKQGNEGFGRSYGVADKHIHYSYHAVLWSRRQAL